MEAIMDQWLNLLNSNKTVIFPTSWILTLLFFSHFFILFLSPVFSSLQCFTFQSCHQTKIHVLTLVKAIHKFQSVFSSLNQVGVS